MHGCNLVLIQELAFLQGGNYSRVWVYCKVVVNEGSVKFLLLWPLPLKTMPQPALLIYFLQQTLQKMLQIIFTWLILHMKTIKQLSTYSILHFSNSLIYPPLSAITLLAGFMMAESAEMGRLMGLLASLRSMMTTCDVSPTFSRTHMNLSDSMVRVLNPMLAALMPTFWSYNQKHNLTLIYSTDMSITIEQFQFKKPTLKDWADWVRIKMSTGREWWWGSNNLTFFLSACRFCRCLEVFSQFPSWTLVDHIILYDQATLKHIKLFRS